MRLSRAAALALALAPLLFTGKALLTGGVYAPIDILYDAIPFGAHRLELEVPPDRTPLLSDVVYQQIPWRAAVRRAYSEGRLPLWNPSVLAGEPLLAVQQAAPLHPGTWIGMLLPLPQAWSFDMSLRLLLALVCAFLFLRELGCGEPAALLGALGWAFSNWMVFYLGVPVMPAAAPFPLLLLGLRRIARAPDRAGAAITVTALLLSVSAGHPETLFHSCAAGGSLLSLRPGPPGRGAPGPFDPDGACGGGPRVGSLGSRAAAAPGGAGAVGRAVEPGPLVRAADAVRAARSRAFSGWRLTRCRTPWACPDAAVSRTDSSSPAAYAGALLLPLAVAGLFSRQRSRWFFLAAALAGLAIWTKTVLADALAKLPLFDIAFNERLLLVTVFSLCAWRRSGRIASLAARAGSPTPSPRSGRWRCSPSSSRAFGAGWGSSACPRRIRATVSCCRSFRWRPGSCSCCIPMLRRRPAVLVTGLVLIFAASRVLEEAGTYPTLPARAFYPRLPILERIPRGAPERVVGDRAGSSFPMPRRSTGSKTCAATRPSASTV